MRILFAARVDPIKGRSMMVLMLIFLHVIISYSFKKLIKAFYMNSMVHTVKLANMSFIEGVTKFEVVFIWLQ